MTFGSPAAALVDSAVRLRNAGDVDAGGFDSRSSIEGEWKKGLWTRWWQRGRCAGSSYVTLCYPVDLGFSAEQASESEPEKKTKSETVGPKMKSRKVNDIIVILFTKIAENFFARTIPRDPPVTSRYLAIPTAPSSLLGMQNEVSHPRSDCGMPRIVGPKYRGVRDGQCARGGNAVAIVAVNRRERLPESRNALVEPDARRRECVELLQREV
jgi:hypothetical protein